MNLKLFFQLFLSFILFTIIGTLTHECGHYVAGKLLGIQSTVHYGYTTIETEDFNPELQKIYERYRVEIEHKRAFPLKDKYDSLIKNLDRNEFYFIVGGPLQTMLTGTIGLVIILCYKKSFRIATTLRLRQWMAIFLSLFWLRELANCVVMLTMMLFTNKRSFRNDEVKIAEYFGCHFTFVTIVTALVALIIGVVITFKFVPLMQRKTFIAAGFAGGVAGYILWLYILGPIILP